MPRKKKRPKKYIPNTKEQIKFKRLRGRINNSRVKHYKHLRGILEGNKGKINNNGIM